MEWYVEQKMIIEEIKEGNRKHPRRKWDIMLDGEKNEITQNQNKVGF